MITFHYEIEKLLDNIRVVSDYRSKTAIDQGEQNIIPSVNVVDDPIAKKLLEDAAGEVAMVMSGHFGLMLDTDEETELENYEYDVTYDGTANCIVFRLDLPDTFNERTIHALDRAVKNAMENYVLQRFLEMVNFDGRAFERMYQKEINKILLYLNVRTETIKRGYKLY